MSRKKRNGFTIEELVIDIAVNAILAAVLIPTFSSLINRANEAADTAMVKNLNTLLVSDEALNGTPETMSDVLETVKEGGYTLEKLTPTSNGDILWDEENNQFVLKNGDEVVYSAKDVTKSAWKLWQIIDEKPTEEKGYSYYLSDNFAATEIEVSAGVDTGTCSVDVVFTTEESKEITICTNGGTLTVNAPLSTVEHRGTADSVNITAIAGESYHEYGETAYLTIISGRIEISKSGYVNIIDASSATASVKIEAENANSIANVIVNGNSNVTTGENLENKKVAKTTVGVESAEYADIQSALDAGEKYIELTSDLEITSSILIEHDVIIDGGTEKHSIISKATEQSNKRGIRIAANNLNVTLKNFVLDVRTNITKDGGYPRGLQIDPDITGIELFVDNCDISATHYAFNVCNNAEVYANFSNSHLTGWGALNLWAADYQVRVTNSVLEGIGENPNESFGTVVLEGDTTDKTYVHSSNIDVEIINSTIKSTVTADGAVQQSVAFNSKSNGNNVKINHCVFEDSVQDGVVGSSVERFYDDGENNNLYIDGEKINRTKEKNCWYSNGPFTPDRSAENSMTTNFETPFIQGWMDNGEGIILDKNIVLENDIYCKLTSGTFYLYFNGKTITGGTIVLEKGVTVISDTDGMETVFSGGSIEVTDNGNGTFSYLCQ